MKAKRSGAVGTVLAALLLLNKCKKIALEFTRIYGAAAYLKGVYVVRDFFLYQMGIFACVMVLVFGVMVMQAAIIFYIPAAPATRCILAFSLGASNFITGALFLRYFASSKRWLRQASKYNAWLKASLKKDQ